MKVNGYSGQLAEEMQKNRELSDRFLRANAVCRSALAVSISVQRGTRFDWENIERILEKELNAQHQTMLSVVYDLNLEIKDPE